MIEKIKCLNLYSFDVGEMVDFYHNVLGRPILFQGFDDEFDGVRLGLSEDKFQITVWDRNKWNAYKGVGPVTIAAKANVQEVYSAIKRSGRKVEEPRRMDWGLELEVNDPDGNYLYIMD